MADGNPAMLPRISRRLAEQFRNRAFRIALSPPYLQDDPPPYGQDIRK
jgi:hypothetical protein